MRRLILLLAITFVMAQTAAAATLDRIREQGVFRIGYRADAKPYSYRDDRGQPAGYIVDLCREVAAALGPNVRTEYVLVASDQRFESVRDSRIDILCDPASVTLARREMVDFSLPIYLDGASALARGSRPIRYFEDFEGKRIGVLAGTTTERTLRESLEDLKIRATIVTVRDHRAGIDMLSDGALDVYFADRGIVAAMLYDGGRPGLELSKHYFSYETYALALPRDDGAFRLHVDRTLARLYRTGRIKALLEKSFGKGPLHDVLEAMIAINALPDR